jgi:hypothetical protein
MTIKQARCLLYGQVFRKCSASKLCRRPAGANNLINELEATYLFKSGRTKPDQILVPSLYSTWRAFSRDSTKN